MKAFLTLALMLGAITAGRADDRHPLEKAFYYWAHLIDSMGMSGNFIIVSVMNSKIQEFERKYKMKSPGDLFVAARRGL